MLFVLIGPADASERLPFYFKIWEVLDRLTLADDGKASVVQHDLGYEGQTIVV